MTKIYRVQMNSKGMPDFSTAVEIENIPIYGNEHNCMMTIFGECSYAETGCGDCAVVEKVRKALSADRPRGEWIPCSERLPDERQDVYVTVFWDDYGDTIIAYGRRTQFGWSLWNTVEGELLKGYTVTAWMPLPEPWKGADDDTD